MARAVLLTAPLLGILVACAPPETEAERSQKLVQASRSYLDFFSAKSFAFLTDTKGSVNARCKQVGDKAINVYIPENLYSKYYLSVIDPKGTNLHIYSPVQDGESATGIIISRIKKEYKFHIPRYMAVDPNGSETDGVYSPNPVFYMPGRYTFIVTGFLPSWYADFDGTVVESDFSFKAYCSVLTN